MRVRSYPTWPCKAAIAAAALIWANSSACPQTATAVHRSGTETWVCTDQAWSAQRGRPPIEFSRKDGFLIEQPLGSPRYELLVNNEHALIGVDHHGDFDPVLGTVNIFVSTVMIDKSTGDFAITTSVRQSLHEHRTGRCRTFESQPPAGLAQRR